MSKVRQIGSWSHIILLVLYQNDDKLGQGHILSLLLCQRNAKLGQDHRSCHCCYVKGMTNWVKVTDPVIVAMSKE